MLKEVVLLASSVLLASPAAEPEIPQFAIDAYRLPNGLKVVLHRDTSVPRVTVCVAYHVGSKNERPGRTGFAHFFEHMMFRGTSNVPNYDIPLQEAGATSNAFTDEDTTVYFETVPSNFLERALYLEAERLAHLDAALDQEKFDTEREVVKNERRQSYENVPYGLAEETIAARVFPAGHPYSWSVIGSMRDLNAAGLDDLRQFFRENYHSANATLCLAGEFDPQQVKHWIELYFGSLTPGPVVARVQAPPSPPVAGRETQIDRVELPRIYWAWPAVANDHPDAPALELLATILTDGEASRLYRTLVRDRRIATDVEADSDLREIAGQFTLEATAAQGHTVEEIEAVFAGELENLRKSPPSERELQRALAQFEKSIYSRLTSPFARALTLATGFAQHDDPAYYRKNYQRYFRVTPADIQRVAQTYLVDTKFALVVRPPQPGESKSKAIVAGPTSSAAHAVVNPPESRAAAGAPDWSRLPAAAAEPSFTPPGFVRRVLSNGLEVRIVPWHTLPVVQCALLIPIGTADDPDGKAGLATLTASLLDKGTRTQSAVEFAEALDVLGTSLSVGATSDCTTVRFQTLKRNLASTLELAGQMLVEPRFAPDEFERERQLQIQDLLQGQVEPQWVAGRAFRHLVHGNHPYGRPSQGYRETVEATSVDDVRAFYQHVGPQGCRLIVVGDVEPDALVPMLESAWGKWTGKTARQARAESTTKPDAGVLYLVDQPGAVQSVVMVGRPWTGHEDSRYYATLVGNRILGDDFLSRLNQNLREEHGYTYGVGSRFSFYRQGSLWSVSTSVRADATAPALQEILRELSGVGRDRPFTAEEIAVNRTGELRNFPDQFDGPMAILGVASEMAQLELPDGYLMQYPGRIRETSSEEIQKDTEQLLMKDTLTYLVVGDRQRIEPALAKLPFREIRVVDADGRPAAQGKRQGHP